MIQLDREVGQTAVFQDVIDGHETVLRLTQDEAHKVAMDLHVDGERRIFRLPIYGILATAGLGMTTDLPAHHLDGVLAAPPLHLTDRVQDPRLPSPSRPDVSPAVRFQRFLTHIHASFSGVIYFEATAFFFPSPPSAFGVIYFEAMRVTLFKLNHDCNQGYQSLKYFDKGLWKLEIIRRILNVIFQEEHA